MTVASSIDPAEVERFSRIAAEWWDPKGKFAPLHKFNPVRLSFIREQALARFGRDPGLRQPFEGLRLLDIGCGGGLLSEPMCRLGFSVTAVDASARNIGTDEQRLLAAATELPETACQPSGAAMQLLHRISHYRLPGGKRGRSGRRRQAISAFFSIYQKGSFTFRQLFCGQTEFKVSK